ncbi:hypothetical protein AB1Y20_021670 [Prymnesium parvum]|uniref:Glutaredoxin domain-containing protein n=1 Tax=Prymnesium parvum TaxID=97485 RepID=A0AB34JM59_PRYPA
MLSFSFLACASASRTTSLFPSRLAALSAPRFAHAALTRLPPAPSSAARARSLVMFPEGGSAEALIKEALGASKVVVFSKSYCPFCAKTKELFNGMGQPFTALELDEREDGAQIQDALAAMTGQRTVPNVFVNGKHVGGNDDTRRAADSGKLQEMLAATE